MTEHQSNSGRDIVDVHNRLDKVVLAVTQHNAASASTTLTPADARQIADLLRQAADTAERTPKADPLQHPLLA